MFMSSCFQNTMTQGIQYWYNDSGRSGHLDFIPWPESLKSIGNRNFTAVDCLNLFPWPVPAISDVFKVTLDAKTSFLPSSTLQSLDPRIHRRSVVLSHWVFKIFWRSQRQFIECISPGDRAAGPHLSFRFQTLKFEDKQPHPSIWIQ